MSQQSTMPTVVRYFLRWVQAFPNLMVLAKAEEKQVLALWEGLGYYSRARNVLRAAKLLQAQVESSAGWPQTVEAWQALPGVGPYTARAIVAICFGGSKLPVDGNVIRVVSRLAGVQDPLNSQEDYRSLLNEVARLEALSAHLPKRELAQALMELGSEVCRPKNLAECPRCPLRRGCWAGQCGQAPLFPAKKERRKTLLLDLLVLGYVSKKDQVLIRKIPDGRPLAGQWELPHWSVPGRMTRQDLAELSHGFEILGKSTHSITHCRYRAFLLRAGQWGRPLPEGHRWLSLGSWQEFSGTLTTLTRKLLFQVEKSRA